MPTYIRNKRRTPRDARFKRLKETLTKQGHTESKATAMAMAIRAKSQSKKEGKG